MRFSNIYTQIFESKGVQIPPEVIDRVDNLSSAIAKIINQKKRLRPIHYLETISKLSFKNPYTGTQINIDIVIEYDEEKKNRLYTAFYSKNKRKIQFNAARGELYGEVDPSRIRGILMHEITHAIDPKVEKGLLNKKRYMDDTKVVTDTDEEFDAYYATIESGLEVMARILGPRTMIKKIHDWLRTPNPMLEKELFRRSRNALNSWKQVPKYMQRLRSRLLSFTDKLETMSD